MAAAVSAAWHPAEERVAMLLLDQLEFPVVFWGSLKAGVVPVALNTLLAAETYHAILHDSRAAALCVSAALLPVVQPLLDSAPHLRAVFVVGAATAPAGCHALAAELAQSESRPPVSVSADECAFWLYSSGFHRRAQRGAVTCTAACARPPTRMRPQC